mmetsp:Transcript_29616/g.88565  ORF Transcript_29616/g.88565 Transcript_29616/m.88565 type:complete len:233 (-) Transcript_29616:260-958(-)
MRRILISFIFVVLGRAAPAYRNQGKAESPTSNIHERALAEQCLRPALSRRRAASTVARSRARQRDVTQAPPVSSRTVWAITSTPTTTSSTTTTFREVVTRIATTASARTTNSSRAAATFWRKRRTSGATTFASAAGSRTLRRRTSPTRRVTSTRTTSAATRPGSPAGAPTRSAAAIAPAAPRRRSSAATSTKRRWRGSPLAYSCARLPHVEDDSRRASRETSVEGSVPNRQV